MTNLIPITPRIMVHGDNGQCRIAVIPVADTARLIGYPHRQLHGLLKRNAPLFDGVRFTVMMNLTRYCERKNGTTYTITRRVPLDCLTELGFYAVTIKLCADRIKDPARIEHVRRVQKRTLAHMRAVQENRCPPSDQALAFEEAACLPRNAVRGAALRQHAEEHGWPLHKVRERAREVRIAAGLPAWKWHREARARILAYLETHPGAPLLKLMEIAGEPITMPTACRIRQQWRQTRAALAKQGLFTTLISNTPNPAA